MPPNNEAADTTQDRPRRAEAALDERIRLLALTADVGTALTTRRTLGGMLQGCAEALVRHLDAAFARVWVLDEAEGVLVLHASAGQYTHLDGPHGRVPVGKFKIGLIAQECRPHLTNSVIGDPRVGDQDWARREGMVAFAGYPLAVDGRVVGVVALFARQALSDVTLEALGAVADEIALGIEGRRAEEALRASEERYRAAFANAAVGVTLADLQGRFLQVNPAFCAITGYSETELLASDSPPLTHPDDRPGNRDLMQRLLAGEIPSFVLEKRCVRKDGRIVWVQNSVSAVRDAGGAPRHTVALTEDVTERKRAAEAIREANGRTAGILESITDAFFALDGQWRFTYINDQGERLLFRTRAALLGRNIWDEFPAAVGTTFEREYRRAVDEQATASFEEFYPPLDKWFEVRAYPSAGGLSVYFHDITGRKAAEAARDRAESALRESEARFRLMADAIPHIAWTTGPDGGVDYYNQRWFDYSGLNLEQTRDWGWEAVVHPDDLARAGGVWRAAVAGGRVSEVEYRLRRADGEFRWHLGRSEPVRDGAGRVIRWVGTATDISERKAAAWASSAALRHEHTIATQLQEALQPGLPGAVPGLALTAHYEAALAEAGVGGDFYDVFALDKGRTALVVGDLSGKGLAAAAQVATVRNMLRAFLYSKPTVAEAATDLNRVLAENNLLSGFATLFVGAYDAGARTLAYANCGQEPALVPRAWSTPCCRPARSWAPWKTRASPRKP